MILKGLGVSKGYGIGKVFVVKESEISFEPDKRCDSAAELNRFNDALEV